MPAKMNENAPICPALAATIERDRWLADLTRTGAN